MCRCAGVRLMGVDYMCENACVWGCVKTRISMREGERSQISKDRGHNGQSLALFYREE